MGYICDSPGSRVGWSGLGGPLRVVYPTSMETRGHPDKTTLITCSVSAPEGQLRRNPHVPPQPKSLLPYEHFSDTPLPLPLPDSPTPTGRTWTFTLEGSPTPKRRCGVKENLPRDGDSTPRVKRRRFCTVTDPNVIPCRQDYGDPPVERTDGVVSGTVHRYTVVNYAEKGRAVVVVAVQDIESLNTGNLHPHLPTPPTVPGLTPS